MAQSLKPKTRAEEHDAMLKEALAQPGVYDVMKVFGQWQEQDCRLNNFYDCKIEKSHIINTSHTSS